MSIKSFYNCSCYYTHNIYVKRLKKHFLYIDCDQFFEDYSEFLNQPENKFVDKESLITEITTEVTRRKQLEKNTQIRKKIIKNNYVPLNKSIYKLEDSFFEPEFLKLVETAKIFNQKEILSSVNILSHEKKIYSFPVFTLEFCEMFLKELKHFEDSDMPKERPNTMNNNGILIDEIGFHDNFTLTFREKYLDPLAWVLFPELRGKGLDSHKIFTVGYKFEQDKDLGYHYDNSEVTLNVCLGEQFEGGELYFGDMNAERISESTCISVPHKIGYGILHRGQQYHGALQISSGTRQNLIVWMRSSSIRNNLCPMCFSKPSLIISNDYGDGFTKPEEQQICDVM